MFGFWKKETVKPWTCSDDLVKFISTQNMGENDLKRNFYAYDQNFESFKKVMDQQQAVWKRKETEFFPGVHSNRLACYKYFTLLNIHGRAGFLIEVQQNVTSSDTLVTVTNLDKCLEIQNAVFREIKSLSTNVTLDYRLDDTVYALDMLREYDELYPLPSNMKATLKIYKGTGSSVGFEDNCYNVKVKVDGVEKIDVSFKISGMSISSTVTIEKCTDGIPSGYSESPLLYH